MQALARPCMKGRFLSSSALNGFRCVGRVCHHLAKKHSVAVASHLDKMAVRGQKNPRPGWHWKHCVPFQLPSLNPCMVSSCTAQANHMHISTCAEFGNCNGKLTISTPAIAPFMSGSSPIHRSTPYRGGSDTCTIDPIRREGCTNEPALS